MTPQEAHAVLREVLRRASGQAFRVRLWDGSEETFGQGTSAFTLVFRDEGTFVRLLRRRDSYHFAMAFCEGRFDVEGDLYAALQLKDALGNRRPGWAATAGLLWKLGLGARHNRTEDKRNVQAHYDVSNEFYKLFLDKRVMAYSCAYFHRPDESLEDAQEHKADVVCRKLRLRPGERLLDIGCGWGGLLIHAATHYGITGHGVTLSKNQYDLARERVAAAGLSDRVIIELRDYRDLSDASFDKIASVGMYEHVGIRRYPEYFGTAMRLLTNGGLFLNHGITVRDREPMTGDGRFMFTRIFPNAELDMISHTLSVMERSGFEILNVESLRPHYAKTLREWERRLSARWDRARALAPEETCRAWTLYMAGCALAFEEGRVSVYQTLASKSGNAPSRTPLTPHDVYCAGERS